ncbi:MAG: hypothetical protein GY715_16965 [Planctomycetes bacterium]|nr:hypothetical protein [Planctomycetota bacterium]
MMTPDEPDTPEEGTTPDPADDRGQPLPLEEDPADDVAALDVCPSCGAPLRGGDTLVCVRCGYDMRTLSQTPTETPPPAEPMPEPDVDPIVPPGRGVSWLPIALIVCGLAVMAWGLLSGQPGLFTSSGGEEDVVAEVAWRQRWMGLARLPVLVGLWSACGVAALALTAWISARPFGDLRLAALRVTGIVAVASLTRFTDLPSRLLEFPIEIAGAALAYYAGTMLLFRVTPREAGTVTGLTAVAFFVTTVLTHFVAWATS